ncbi:collagen-binding domain-containing protein [Sandaracinobacter neustonicus]|nr:collagen-binding domain-containing protein [Sandaracinobacter neustonicus]
MNIRLFATLAAGSLVLAAQPALATAPVGDPLGGLQAMRELNAIVFGDTHGWLSVEGKTFVGGTVQNGGEFGGGNASKSEAASSRAILTVGGNSNSYTRILNGSNGGSGSVGSPATVDVGGNVSNLALGTNNVAVKIGGTVAQSSASSGSTVESGGTGSGWLGDNGGSFATGKGAGFTSGVTSSISSEAAKLEADLTALSTSLAGLETTDGNSITNSYGAMVFTAVSDGTGKSVFNLTEAAFSGWQWTLNAADPTLTIVFNVTGDGSYLWNSNLAGAFSAFADQIIWNFSDATSLNINQTVYGSLLSPFADLRANSAIRGTVVAKDLQASSGVKMAAFDGTDIGLADPAPEPATWAMMIAGFGLVGAALRRRERRGRIAHSSN